MKIVLQTAVCLGFCGGTALLGADSRGDSPGQTQRFTTRSEAVRVDALVTRRGRLIRGLTAQDFEVRDEGVLQQIALVDEEAEPLNLICLIDTGGLGRFATHFRQLLDAGRALVDSLQPRDRVSLMAFSNRVRFLTTLTSDHAVARSTLHTLYLEGHSAVRDAVFAALVMRQIDPGRTIILLASHGWDHISWVPPQSLLDAARRTDAVVYAATYEHAGVSPMKYARLLDDLAEETGGRVLVVEDGRDLRGVFVNILAEFRSRYVLTYVPTGVSPGGWHRLEVALKGRLGDVKARRGYFSE